jgi:pimeloyl-ACP methyl ester carboxylesterase
VTSNRGSESPNEQPLLEPIGPGDRGQGRLRYLSGGTGAPLVLLHTVRTQAEHFRHLIPLVLERYTVYALDLPGIACPTLKSVEGISR